jgi:hypothetical protein
VPKLDDVATGDYVVPIYIDSSALIDVLASIEGGFSSVETFRSTNSDSVDTGFSTEIGSTLRLLKLNLAASNRNASESAEETSGQRYHSPGSLLNRLRRHLRENDLLRRPPTWDNISPADFVEFRGVFRPNPVSQVLVTMRRTLELLLHWPDKRNGKAGASGMSFKQMLEMTNAMLADLHIGDRYLFVVDAPGAPKIVAPILVNLLRDKTLSEIANGEFRVTGKVVRRLSDPDGEALELFPGSAIAALPNIMNAIVEAFQFLGDAGMTLPKIEESRIRAPAFVVLPIGISV